MKTFSTLCMAIVAATTLQAQNVVEKRLYTTDFQDWEAVKSTTTPTKKTVTTNASKEQLDITFAEVEIAPTGVKGQFTNTEVITAGYAMAAKSATPYIETSVLKSVTRVEFVHAATGSSRGWGLLCKSPEAEKWDTLSTAFCEQRGTKITVPVNRENVQLRWFNLNAVQNAYMTEFTIYGNVTVVPRTFTDFEIDLTKEEPVLPTGVQGSGASYNDAQHGWVDYTIGFKVDGPVRITLGGCQYANKAATVTSGNSKTLLATIDTKSVGCYHNGGTATWTYNVEEADSLIVYCGQYCPYIKVEACDYVESHTVVYFDQNGTRLGAEEVLHGTAFAPKYSISDLTIAEGFAFRGWTTNMGLKVAEGTAIEADMKVYALVTEIEKAVVGTHYIYNMTKASWYQEDHECITITGGKYYNNHGWNIAAGGMVEIAVAGKAYIQVTNCQYSAEADVTVTSKLGKATVTTFAAKAEPDGTTTTFFYNGTANTLVLTFGGQAYLHSVAVYNVADEILKDASGMFIVPAGDAASLLLTLMQLQDGDRVFLPNGVYDLGETVLTQVSANNVSLIGQSMEGVVIKNAPDAVNESINNTATLLLTGNNIYLQDLTLQNALDYYKANNGRAVALWDKGTHTICKNVRLLSYQDTYYSNKIGAVRYFEGGEIHGTVDYICGDGSVFFEDVLLYCEKRSSTGGGSDVITASNADQNDKGYVFNRCRIQSECPVVSFGRAWNNAPQCVFLNTIADMGKGEFGFADEGKIARWTLQGMNVLPAIFGEYNTTDTEGKVISPASNLITFTYKDNTKQLETILSADEVAKYAYTSFFGEWNPAAETAQESLYYTIQDGAVVWETTTATRFMIEKNGVAAFVTELPAALEEGMTVRAANSRGGFGPAAINGKRPMAIDNTTANSLRACKRLENGQVLILHQDICYSVLGTILH